MLSYEEACEYMSAERARYRNDARKHEVYRIKQFEGFLRWKGISPRAYVHAEVCQDCGGAGVQSLHGAAISRHEFDDDPDFEEAYFRGDYDSPCKVCNGQRVVKVIARDVPEALLAEFEQSLEEGCGYDDALEDAP